MCLLRPKSRYCDVPIFAPPLIEGDTWENNTRASTQPTFVCEILLRTLLRASLALVQGFSVYIGLGLGLGLVMICIDQTSMGWRRTGVNPSWMSKAFCILIVDITQTANSTVSRPLENNVFIFRADAELRWRSKLPNHVSSWGCKVSVTPSCPLPIGEPRCTGTD